MVGDSQNSLIRVSETHRSCDTVGRELWLAILSSLLCPETDRNIRIGKQGYVFILSDVKGARSRYFKQFCLIFVNYEL